MAMEDMELHQEVAVLLRAWFLHLTGTEPPEDELFEIAGHVIRITKR